MVSSNVAAVRQRLRDRCQQMSAEGKLLPRAQRDQFHATFRTRFGPTFADACAYNPAFLRVYAKHLRSFGFPIPVEDGTCQRFTDDTSVPGKGDLLVWRPRG
jgi:hypothetical protein